MSAQHTPGPWTYSRWDQFGDARFYVAQAEGAPYTPNYSDVATLITETVSDERTAIQEANARLIAAAPELLAALQHVVRHRDQHNASDFEYYLAAIAKATGADA